MTVKKSSSTQPVSSWKKPLAFGIVCLLIAIIFGALGYFTATLSDKNISKTQEYDLSKVVSKPEPKSPETVVDATPKTTFNQPEVWTGKITLKPKNYQQFKSIEYKENIEGGCQTGGVISNSYYSNENSGVQTSYTVTNKNLWGKNSIEKFNKIKSFIEQKGKNYLQSSQAMLDIGEAPKLNQNTITFNDISVLFYSPCEYYGLGIINTQPKEIFNKEIGEGLVFTTSNRIEILTQNGDNLVLLSQPLITSNEFEELSKKCEKEGKTFVGMDYRNEFCPSEKIVALPDYQSLVDNKVQELLKTFELE